MTSPSLLRTSSKKAQVKILLDMVLFPFKKYTSKKTICCSEDHDHDLDHQQKELINKNISAISLTVWRKSLLFSCEGFTVIGSDGNLVFRVDNYTGRYRPTRVILMDGLGKPTLTMFRRKKLGLVDTWLVFEGEVEDCSHKMMMTKKPIFSVRKSLSTVLQSNFNVLAYVYRGVAEKRCSYVIEGSYAIRSCKVLDESRSVVAEIKKKEAVIGGVSFGLEVFLLIVHPGFDSGLAMALTLLLDQMFS